MDQGLDKYCSICGINTFTPIKCSNCNLRNKDYFYCRKHIFNHKHNIGHTKKDNNLQLSQDKKSKKKQRCTFYKCKTKITLINYKCYYCNDYFCVEHQLPEIHKCENF